MKNYTQVIFKNNDRFLLSPAWLTPKGIMVHSTGCDNPNVSRYVPIGTKYSSLHWNRPGVKKCVNGFIGKMPDGSVDFVQTLPFNMKGWHAGTAAQGKTSANNTHISFECCEDSLDDKDYFRKVWNKAVEVCAELCREFNLNPLEKGVIISHAEGHKMGIASNHGDIDHWFKIMGMTMDEFRKQVDVRMKGEDDEMSYEQFKEYMDRYLKEQGDKPYSDWAVRKEVPFEISKTGISDGKAPRRFCTREEAFLMLLNAEKRIVAMFGGNQNE